MRYLKNNSEKKGDDVDNDNEAKKGLRLKTGWWSRFSNRPLRFHNYLGLVSGIHCSLLFGDSVMGLRGYYVRKELSV